MAAPKDGSRPHVSGIDSIYLHAPWPRASTFFIRGGFRKRIWDEYLKLKRSEQQDENGKYSEMPIHYFGAERSCSAAR